MIFIIITSLIYTLTSHFFHIEEELINFKVSEKSAIGSILKWMQGNYGYTSILTGIFIAIWLKVFFKKYEYNFYEILIMLCFVQGISMLIFAVFALLEGISHFKLLSFAGLLVVVYMTWAIGSFFEARRFENYAKAFIAFFLGTITFYAIIFVIGISVDVLTQH